MVSEKDIYVNWSGGMSWIHVERVGAIGMYYSREKEIHLDYSMKWIVGTNEVITCEPEEIKNKVVALFNQ